MKNSASNFGDTILGKLAYVVSGFADFFKDLDTKSAVSKIEGWLHTALEAVVGIWSGVINIFEAIK